MVAYFRSVSDIFRAIADPARRGLLDALRAANGQTLGELCAHLAMSRQAVSKHLGKLEQAGLIAVKKRGREKRHYLRPAALRNTAVRWLARFAEA